MATDTRKPETIAIVLQGGGALGAYQAGAYEALASAGLEPEWISGISIGAINSAIIAGNPPERRVERLRQFWDQVSSNLTARPIATDTNSRRIFSETSAALIAAMGAPGFFRPRLVPPVFNPPGSMEAISLYDTTPLRATLLELVDFDLLNSNAMRFSVGAVQVSNGNMRYFDSAREKIGPEHIMASGALPPGFPPVVIDGQAYWDGGLVSNTPLEYLLDDNQRSGDMCVFQLDLFSAKGPVPETLFDISQREKDIRYSSRTRLNTDIFRNMQTIRRALRRIEGRLPDDIKETLDWRFLSAVSCDAAITIVHLIHRRAAYSSQSNDYEFSRSTIEDHWQAGYDDVVHTLNHPDWKARKRPTEGVVVLDLTRDLPGQGLEVQS